ncbi:hypothetical protein CF651_16765 [Paenibacillus rigui]|uniref:Uncharacterized protein n=2 Tax=Paenibacillus rigui TaxID=554312 RepID=A0A229UNZ1_9BACL|nr:hypothetical protein CF651_16765 [Paenibacillus rigui]
MLEEVGVYAVAVGLIGIMLVLCIDVIRRNRHIVQSFSREAVQTAEGPAADNELQQVYPPYIDCSKDFAKQYLSHHSVDMDPLAQKQGA